MLDIKFIRENENLVEEKARQKGYVVSLEKLLNVDNKRRKLVNEVDKLRADRKKAAESREDKTGSDIKAKLKQKEDELEKLNEEFYQLIREVPNLPKKDVKVGKDESENEVIRKVGELPKFDFEPKDHLELGSGLDILDIERASKVSGSRFFYLKNELVALEFALVKFALEILAQEDFIQVIPPVLINKKVAGGLGYPEYETGEGYKVDDQYLVGTAEHSIVPMHMDETFAESDLPRRYVAFSTAFRREAGSYGKDTRGILRQHQFDISALVFHFLLPAEGRLYFS